MRRCWNCGRNVAWTVREKFVPGTTYVVYRGWFWCEKCDVLWIGPHYGQT